ncbi:MAG: hypothetical protein HYX47_14685 [Burkholderiales bacterium]|nr:hypothetical protein [Burkholderiales bacterium]
MRKILFIAALACTQALAAPFTPKSDSEIVDRLPARASDPEVRRVESLRKQLAANPNDAKLRVEIARRYFEMAMAQGDPRYIGYAQATITPLATATQDNAGYWLVRGQLEQYSHSFEPALASLERAAKADTKDAQPLAWRAAIFMVQARYPEALAECARLTPLTQTLFGAGCSAYVEATTGQLQAAYDKLLAARAAATTSPPELLLWADTRLAEMAVRLQQPDAAEKHFKQALGQGITDQFLLGAWADFLLERNRPAEVIKLLADWERSDVLLLRLALAGKATKDGKAGDWAAQLKDRFDAAAQRGDRLHEQEAARFELDVQGEPKKALEFAARNYTVQKEPRDAEILMRAALAAKDAKAAQPALDWLRASKYEDARLAKLAEQLGATR